METTYREEAKQIFPIGIILDSINKVSDKTCRMIQSDIAKALEVRENAGLKKAIDILIEENKKYDMVSFSRILQTAKLIQGEMKNGKT